MGTTQLIFAQSSEQKVREAVNKINQMVEEVHQLAADRNIDAAFKKLNQINRTFSTETTWGTFNEEYRNAKMENPAFDFQIRGDLPANLDAIFWKDYQRRCDRIMADQNQALEGFKSMMELNKWDKIMAYGAQIKNSYETIKNATENLASGNIPKFAYDLYGNMNDFIKNYTKIEDAEIAGVDIQTQKMEFQNMITKAEINKNLYRDLESTINVNIDMIHTFQSNIKYVKDLKSDAASGPLKPLGPTLDYLWNYESYENNIKDACDDMEVYEIKCAKLKEDIVEIKSEARRNWRMVMANISASDDEANKPQYIADNKELWNEFETSADKMYDDAYQLYCIDNSAGSDNSTSSDNASNPFDGAAAKGSTATDEFPEEETNTATGNNTINPNNSSYIGTISAGGGHGKYAALEIKNFKNNDRIVFVRKSGTLKHVQLIWRKQGGIWETAYEGSKTDFRFGDLINKMPGGTTHLNFVVNANHNRWSTNDVACVMDVFLVHGSGSGTAAGSSGSQTGASTSENSESNGSSQSSQNSEPENTYAPPPETPKVSSVNKEFAELINKANESFNKPYWEESQGTRVSSNPKQESLDYLVKASRLINREPDLETKFNMVQQLVSTSTRFAQRVHAFKAKVPFINLAGQTASRAGSQISSIQASDTKDKKELQKFAYRKIAASWRAVRDATLIHGGTNYSKESCDKEYLKYKNLSER